MPRRRTSNQQQEQELEGLSTSLHPAHNNSTGDNINNNNINLSDLVKALQEHQDRIRTTTKIKPPQFDGTGDVELFLLQFNDVAKLNKWHSEEHLLHLRLSLTKNAMDCSRGKTMLEIEEMLQVRFGTSPRQAREKLRRLKRLPKQTVYELGLEAQKLTRLAYPNIGEQDLEDITLETFIQALDSKAIKRHLLATQAATVAEAIQKVDEYLQVGDNSPTMISAIQHSTTEVESSETQSMIYKRN